MAEQLFNPRLVAEVLSGLITRYFKRVAKEESESRLLVPAPTSNLGYKIQEILLNSLPVDIPSLLVVDTDKDPPSEEKGWISPVGLTSRRIGSMVILTQPGQLSRIQESVAGSGGTVRLAFRDEWPWLRDEESELFSFSDSVLPTIISNWTADPIEQEWLTRFLWIALIPSIAETQGRAALLFDDLLARFDPAANEQCGDVRQRFLYHCGVPRMSTLETLPDSFISSAKDLCNKIASRMPIVSRAEILQNCEEFTVDEAELKVAINRFFDSAGSKQRVGFGVLAVSHCLKGLQPTEWRLLTCDLLEKLYRIQKQSKLTLQATIESVTGIVSPQRKDLVDIRNNKCEVSISWSIEGSNISPDDYCLELKYRQKVLHSQNPPQKKGNIIVPVDLAEFPHTLSKLLLTARISDRRDPINPQSKTSTVRVHLLHSKRSCCLFLLEPFLVCDPVRVPENDSTLDEEHIEGETVDEPSFVYIADCRADGQAELRIDGQLNDLISVGVFFYRSSIAVDPSSETTGQIIIEADFGEAGKSSLNLDSSSPAKGELNIEDELIQQLKSGRPTKVRQVWERFSGEELTPFPALGGLTQENQTRIEISKVLESSSQSEVPIILDFSAPLPLCLEKDTIRYSAGLEATIQHLIEVQLEEGAHTLIEEYRKAREQLLQLFHDHYGEGSTPQSHPLCSRSPVYIHTRRTEIEARILEYLNAYTDIISSISGGRWRTWATAFALTYLDCVVGIKDSTTLSFPYFLLGPWHPMVVAQRFERQAALYSYASRYLQQGSGWHKMANLFYEFDGLKRIHAIADASQHHENAYICTTSDPNWYAAIRTADYNLLSVFTNSLWNTFGLNINTIVGGSEALTQSYVRRYLQAHPAKRRLDIGICSGLNCAAIVSDLEQLLFKSNGELTTWARQLPGGVHLYVENYDGNTLGEMDWKSPPICIYNEPSRDGADFFNDRDVDIVLVAPRLENDFKPIPVNAEQEQIPRGVGPTSGLSTTVTWLEQAASGVANSICHEIDQVARSTGSEVTDALLKSAKEISKTVPSDFYTVRPMEIPKDVRASWIVVPGYNANPSAFIQYVLDSASNDRSLARILWEYNIDLRERRSEYYILSEVPAAFRHAMSSTPIRDGDSESVIQDLGSIGIAMGSETVKTGTKALGVVGQIGAARLMCYLSRSQIVDGRHPLVNGPNCAGLLFPVDSFDTVLGTTSYNIETTNRKSDLLAIQLCLPKEDTNPLLISACSVECKFSSSLFPRSNILDALDQARQTYIRFKQLVLDSRDNDGILERLVLCQLIRYGLQIQKDYVNERSAIFQRNSTILSKILSGHIRYREPAVERLLVSTECGLAENQAGFSAHDGGLWVRLSPQGWPGIREDSDVLKKIRSKLNGIFYSSTNSQDYQSYSFASPENASTSSAGTVPLGSLPGGTDKIASAIDSAAKSKLKTPDASVTDRKNEKPTSSDVKQTGVKFSVGYEIDTSPKKAISFWPSNTKLNQLNVGIVGDLGTGKTQLVMALMLHFYRSAMANQGTTPKFLIFDYKGDYTKPEFVNALNATVLTPKRIPLNFFSAHTHDSQVVDPAIERARFAFDTLKKIYGGLGPVQQMNLREATKEGYRVARGAGVDAPTIFDVCNEYSVLVKGRPDSMLAILSGIVDNQLFEVDSTRVKSLDDIFQSTIVLDLRALGQDDDTKNMLVAIFLNIYYEYMLTREKKPFFGPENMLRHLDSMLVVDEADSIMKYNFPILKSLLLQGREFGIGVWLASQYLSHFRTKSEDYRQPLLTWFLHKVPNITAKDLREIGLINVDASTADRVKKQNLFECLYKSHDVPGLFIRGTPFYVLMRDDKRI